MRSTKTAVVCFLLVSILFIVTDLLGQHVNKPEHLTIPIPIEFLAGNNTFGLQTQINKYFSPTSRFNFLSITNAVASYSNDAKNFDFINSRPLKTQFWKKGQKNRVGQIIAFENGIKNMRQEDKWIYLPLVDHPFEVHARCG